MIKLRIFIWEDYLDYSVGFSVITKALILEEGRGNIVRVRDMTTETKTVMI